MILSPDFARVTLAVLGAWQAKERDDYRDAEPGKILHELRLGELAALKLIPHTPYYGTADATPLYLVILHALWRATGDKDLLRSTWTPPRAASPGSTIMATGTRTASRNTARAPASGYENVGWKDSGEAVVYTDGSQGARAQGALRAAGLCLRGLARHGGDVRSPRQHLAGGLADGESRRALYPLQRRVLERGRGLLRLLPRRREEAGLDRGVQPRPFAVVRHRPAGAGASRRRPAQAARHVERLGHPHAQLRTTRRTIPTPTRTARSGRTTTA